MGTCWNCNTQLSLEKEQTKCDCCGEIILYKCNDCHTGFKIIDKETKLKLQECKFCGYFKCPSCGICSWNCDRFKWEKEILKIFVPEINQTNCPTILEKIRKIINFFEEIKSNSDRLSCHRKVPITYAKARIKSLLARMEGLKVKNMGDQEAFIQRIDEITEIPIGEEKTISNVREKGSYGQEYRDVFNLLVCFGKFERNKRKIIIAGEEIEYEYFVRCEKEICSKLSKDNLILNECPKCKKIYSNELEHCSSCPPLKKGKNKGEQRKLKKRLSNKDCCQLYRGDFNKTKDGKSNKRME